MSLLGADCPVDRSTGAERSLKIHADRSVLNCGVVLAGIYNYVFVFYSPKVTVVKSAVDDNGLVC